MGKGSCVVVTLVFLVLVLAAAALVQSQEDEIQHMSRPEMYEIDYRGPETHSSLPPPQSLGGPKAKPSRKRDVGGNRKATHG
ncbi:uncharacterized protein [Elaeis guineensis]|uniref:Uncharacterized protein LOC105044632 n=1 Tax=Elaeis guineensis var. tenera TaxID=51953 RepID=A0A6I9R7A3_ELAGV|nr:uncharacterized protein LOC105044632 [Elaeis guineensis]